MKHEEKFDIEINHRDAEKLVTVDDVSRYISQLFQKRA